MGLSIDIKIPGGGDSAKGGGYKGIVPGNYKAKINEFMLWDEHWRQDNGLFIVMRMETAKPNPEFEGYPINSEDPEGPKHDGLVGNVKYSTYAYKTKYDARKGKEVPRDVAILEDMLRLCIELDCVDWFKAAQGKYETSPEWIEAFNNDMPYKDKYLEVCIAGEQYFDKEGKLKTGLHFAKYEKEGTKYINAYKSLTNPKKIVQYDEAIHFKKVEAPVVNNFDTASEVAEIEVPEISVDDMPFDVDSGFDI
jgi:hypothetical protein